VVVQDGFKPGQHLLVSDLAAPVAGMPVRIESEDKKQQNSRSK
jgi:hypothetical protein